MVEILRTSSEHPDFQSLVRLLDAELAERDGEDNAFYAQYNKIDLIRHAIVAYQDGQAIGCGAIKTFDEKAVEVKRMFTLPAMRGLGIARIILSELEKWAAELSYEKCVLETGKRQPEAIALYLKQGYSIIPNYGQYIGIENSVCFEKMV
ncbi:MAG TPA: GNAT family N-acetyltransferase [Saprospiraceae bacterium]|nr:GNAT family N-acetyltransferase [Saprospiraceae bacterium]HMQ82610.1 GNAT family N-acetyltransferase [Saprospiraceae bacterium]